MLRDLKVLLGFDPNKQEPIDDKLSLIMRLARSRLKFLLEDQEPPESMDYIIIDVAITRYNRIGSEGMKIQNVEGLNQHFFDSDFDPFMADIQKELDRRRNKNSRGRARFV